MLKIKNMDNVLDVLQETTKPLVTVDHNVFVPFKSVMNVAMGFILLLIVSALIKKLT